MRDKKLFILNIIAIVSFIFYALGIYLQVVFQGIEWGNILVYTLLQMLGNESGVMMVVIIGAFALLILYKWSKFNYINVFLCWFFILSLYQCAVNSFLQFNGLPDEPINQFFKILFPEFWYPAKEIVFIIISLLLTLLWFKKMSEVELKRIEVILIILLSLSLIIIISLSQILLINA
jgi:hypothetical protein